MPGSEGRNKSELFRKMLRVVYRLALAERIALLTSRPLLAELGRVLGEKFGWEPERVEEAVAQLVRRAEIVDPQERISEIDADPADHRVLEAAGEGRVEAIVSPATDICSHSNRGTESQFALPLRSSSIWVTEPQAEGRGS